MDTEEFIWAGVVFPGGKTGCGSASGSDQSRCWHRDDKHQLGPGPEWIVMAGAPAAEQRQIQEDRAAPLSWEVLVIS